ncbi:MAG: hypothetical protein KatS3mg103_0591 [Phycisphaerales bacterium]|nr:MAG: hypothetical protein KatS3mg103_0591 [Phycisphaerales bacterium]
MTTNPFDILGLPVRYDLDQTEIEQAYLARIARSHPDLAQGADQAADQDADRAADQAWADPSALNEARAALLDPAGRARAVLAVRAPGVQTPPLAPEFLAEIMDVREQAEQAVQAGDRQAVERWRRWAADRRSDLASRLGILLEGQGPLASDRATEAAGLLQQWRYFERMLEQVGIPQGSDRTPTR